MTARVLRIVPLGEPAPESELVHWLGAELARRMPLAPVEEPLLPLAGEAVAPGGAPIAADHVLDALIERFPAEADPPVEWVLALTRADIRSAGGTSVFGEATAGGGWALVGLARLRRGHPEPDEERLRHRALVEALHELGHVAGLGHCPDPRCAMAEAADVADVDAKPAAFCGRCGAFVGALVPPGGGV